MNKTGKPKTCNKVRLKTKAQAEKHLGQVEVLNSIQGKEKRNKGLHVYLCDCGWWHVGHSQAYLTKLALKFA